MDKKENIDLKSEYKINPEVYNHMSNEEKKEYKDLIGTYNINHARKFLGFILMVFVFFLLMGAIAFISEGGDKGKENIVFVVIIGIILVYIVFNLFTKKNATTYNEIKALEDVALYRIKEKQPKSRVEDWKEKKETDYKKEVTIKKDINIEKSETSKIKFCSGCGKKIKEQAKFCEYCGAKQ